MATDNNDSSSPPPLAREWLTRSAFLRAVQPVCGMKFRGVLRKKPLLVGGAGGLLTAVVGGGSKTKKNAMVEFQFGNNGDDIPMFLVSQGGRESTFRCVGPFAEAVLDTTSSTVGFDVAVVIRGPDLRKNGKPGWEIIIECIDGARQVSKWKNAVAAVSRCASRPDGICKFVPEEPNVVAMPSLNNNKQPLIMTSKEQAYTSLSRSLKRLSELSSCPKDVFVLARRENDNMHVDMCANAPPGSPDEPNDSILAPILVRSVTNNLSLLKSPCITATAFHRYVTDTGRDLPDRLSDLLDDLPSRTHVVMCQDITRAVRHLVIVLDCTTFSECAAVFGFGVLEGFERARDVESLAHLFEVSCSSQYRLRVFSYVLHKKLKAETAPVIDVPLLRLPTINYTAATTTTPASASTVMENTAPPRHSSPLQQPPPQQQQPLPTVGHVVRDSTEDLSQHLGAMVRLRDWYRQRLADEPESVNAHLWLIELTTCEDELSAFPSSSILALDTVAPPPLPPPHSQPIVTNGHLPSPTPTKSPVVADRPRGSSSALAIDTSSSVTSLQDDATTTNHLVKTILNHWASSRTESLEPTGPEQKRDAEIMLQSLLNDVQDLVQTVPQQFEDAELTDPSKRQSALTMISLLEDNIKLRLQIVQSSSSSREMGNGNGGKPHDPHAARPSTLASDGGGGTGGGAGLIIEEESFVI